MRHASKRWATTYGPWALVIGIDDRLRAEFAHQLAAEGLDIVVTGGAADALEELSARLRAEHRARVRTVALDTSHPELLPTLARATRDLEIGLMVTEVGAPLARLPAESDLDSEIAIVELNLRGPAQLAKHFGERMAVRGRGGIVFLGPRAHPGDEASGAERVAGYHTALAEAFWYELTPRGVDVLAAAPSAGRREAKAAIGGREARAAVRRILEDLRHSDSRVPGRSGTVMNHLGSWIFSRDPSERLAGALVDKVTRSNMN